MAWTAPMTATANTVFTAAQFNTHVRDNLNETAPAKATTAGGYFVTTAANAITERTSDETIVSTTETTSSTTYADLTTVGPSRTVTSGSRILIIFSALLSNNTASESARMGVDISGATTVAPNDNRALTCANGTGTTGVTVEAAYVYLHTGLTPGSHTLKAVYRSSSAGSTASFGSRRLAAFPF